MISAHVAVGGSTSIAVLPALRHFIDTGLTDFPVPLLPEPLCADSELAHFWLFFTQIPASPLVCAMSAVGHCGDNAACEGLFGMLKRKRIYRTKYPTLDAARTDVFE